MIRTALRAGRLALCASLATLLCSPWTLVRAAPGSPALPAAGVGVGLYGDVERKPVGGDGGWDYLLADPATQRVFVSRGNRVQVLDGASGQPVGLIGETPGVHGIALLPALGKGYVSNGREHSVLVFDAASLLALKRIFTPEGLNPDFILADPARREILVFNGRSHNMTVIDAEQDSVVAVIGLGGKPEGAALDAHGHLFVAIEDRNAIDVVDLATRRRLREQVIDDCEESVGVGVDSTLGRVFVACHNQRLFVLDADSGRTLARLPIGAGVDALSYDAAARRVLTSQGDGTLSVIEALPGDHYRVAQTLRTQPGARTMALDPVSHTVYLVTSAFGPVPAPTADNPEPRAPPVPGSFTLLVARPTRSTSP